MKFAFKFFVFILLLLPFLMIEVSHCSIISHLQTALTEQNSFIYTLLLSFLAGVLISFTPCVYPMIPITAGILQTQASNSLFKNFLSAVFYVFGLAIIYAILGFISAITTVIFGQWTSNPIFILFITVLFLYFAFSLFGFYEVRIPTFLSKISPQKTSNSILSSFLFGFFSGAITSPCVTPALAALLTFVADKGNPVLGFFALFFFALGMGILLIVIGTFSTILSVLPGVGDWMLKIKKILGFTMLAVATHFARPLLPVVIITLLYLAVGFATVGYVAIIVFRFFKTLELHQNL